MKRISWILVLCMVMALLAGCSSSSSGSGSSKDEPSIELDTTDLLTEHTAFLMDDGESYTEYHIIYYGNDTHALQKMSIQVQFDKEAGYTEEFLNEYDVEEAYPGFNSFSFASKEVVDDGDYFTLIVTFDDLTDMDNIEALEENGIIETDDNEDATYLDADSYMDWMRSQGAVEVKITDDAYLTLHF